MWFSASTINENLYLSNQPPSCFFVAVQDTTEK
nr:MAG TPA: hypothetical protein [Caudoviricetes sp.]